MTNPGHTIASKTISRRPLRSFAIVVVRLRWPCGARMAIITMVAARMTAFAYHGLRVVMGSQSTTPVRPFSLRSDFNSSRPCGCPGQREHLPLLAIHRSHVSARHRRILELEPLGRDGLPRIQGRSTVVGSFHSTTI